MPASRDFDRLSTLPLGIPSGREWISGFSKKGQSNRIFYRKEKNLLLPQRISLRKHGKCTSKPEERDFDSDVCVLKPRHMQLPHLIQADIFFVVRPPNDYTVEIVVLKLN